MPISNHQRLSACAAGQEFRPASHDEVDILLRLSPLEVPNSSSRVSLGCGRQVW
jgi:hypothetical protein